MKQMKKIEKIRTYSYHNVTTDRFITFLIVLATVISGIYLLNKTHAQTPTPYATIEAENGSVTKPATTVTNDPTASNNAYVQFGTPPTSGGGGGATPGCSSPFVESVLCKPIADATVVSNSATMVKDIQTQIKDNYGDVTLNNTDYGIPIYRVTGGTAYEVKTACSNVNYSTPLYVPIPTGAKPATGGDHGIIIYDTATGQDWEFWDFTVLGTNDYEACDGGEIADVATSNGAFPTSGSQEASSGITYLGTLITEQDVLSGSIDHALSLQLVYCNGGYIPPARSNYDCGSGNGEGTAPYGQYFRFPPGMAMPSGLTTIGKMVFTAIQTYGMVLTDKSGAVAIPAETSVGWDLNGAHSGDPITDAEDGSPNYASINNLPWGDLQAVTEP